LHDISNEHIDVTRVSSDQNIDELLQDLFALQIWTIQTQDAIANARVEQKQINIAIARTKEFENGEMVSDETSMDAENRVFRTGDRVVITNSIKGSNYKEGVMTPVVGKRIHLRTSNGFYPWRVAKNLRFA
jgi:hypothetical protein